MLALSLGALACGSDDAKSEPESAAHADPAGSAADETLLYEAPPQAYLRLDLFRTADAVSVERSEVITRGRPVHSLNGDTLVVAYAGDVARAAVPVTFPSELHAEAWSSEGGHVGSALPLETRHASAFLPWSEDLTRVQVLDANGSELLELSLSSGAKVKSKVQSLSERDFNTKFPHVRIVDRSDASFNIPAEAFEAYGATLAEATPELLDMVAAGLNLMAPAARAATTTVIATHFGAGGVPIEGGASFTPAAVGGGGEIYVNADYTTPAYSAESMASVIVHEGAHNFALLIDASALGESWLDAYPAEAQAMARDLIDQHRLSHGLRSYWNIIQESAANYGLGGAYAVEPSGDPLTDGFATAYGATNVDEDIAEVVSEVQVPYTEASPICRFFRNQGGTLSAEAALLYTKALFARHLGLITEARFRDCTGGLQVASQGDGIFLESTSGSLALTQDVAAGPIEEGGMRFLGIRARDDASGYRTLLRVADPEGLPLGAHRLNFVHINNTRTTNGFLAAHDEVNLARGSASGVVFITEAGPERVQGFILMLSMHNALNVVTDLFWMVPFSAPLSNAL